MGLFGRKEICPVCGKRIKGDVLIRIRDNVSLCRDCSAMVNMDAALIPLQSVEDIKEHLKYRRENLERFERFQTTWEAKAGSSFFCVDEFQKIWYCTRNRRDRNPPVFSYDAIVGFQYLEDGQAAAEEEKKGVLDALFGEKKDPVSLHSMKIHIDLDNPYTRSIDIEAVPQHDEVKAGSLVYKTYRRPLEKIAQMLEQMTGSGREESALSGEQTAENHAGTEITGEESEQEIIEKYDNI